MYIDLNIVYFGIGLLVCALLVYLIVTLTKVNKLIDDSRELLIKNKDNIDQIFTQAPQIVSNINDITEVATDITADIVVTKENMKSNLEVVSDVVGIVKNVMAK